jgi:hypothetical protein
MNINVFITPNKVYATYRKTICHKEDFNPNDYEAKQGSITRAQSIAFSHGTQHGLCLLKRIEIEEEWGDDELFNYLETNIH